MSSSVTTSNSQPTVDENIAPDGAADPASMDPAAALRPVVLPAGYVFDEDILVLYNLIGISLINSLNNNISNNSIFSNSQYNIYVSTASDNNILAFNMMNNSDIAVKIYVSVSNKIYKNCIKNNRMGVYCCCGGKMNYFYNNCLANNSEANAKVNQINIWYDNETGTGNYWDDYNDSDDNNDGKGDTPYEISYAGNQDSYPLMTPPLDIPYKQ